MADVFLSYKRDERAAAEQIASRLRELALTVWFDASMSAGETFNAEIDREARAAKAILVCWSPTARHSEWVNAEAMIGFEQKKLAACYVSGPDGFSPPTPFNTTHTEDLRSWLTAQSDAHASWKSILRRLGKLCQRADIEDWGALDVNAGASELRSWILTHDQSPLFMSADTLLALRQEEEATRSTFEREARERRAVEQAQRVAAEADQRAQRERDVRRDELVQDEEYKRLGAQQAQRNAEARIKKVALINRRARFAVALLLGVVLAFFLGVFSIAAISRMLYRHDTEVASTASDQSNSSDQSLRSNLPPSDTEADQRQSAVSTSTLPPPAGPLAAYLSYYPWQSVHGVSFLSDPTVLRAVREAVGDPLVQEFISSGGPTNPIRRQGAYLRADGCEAHACDSHNWSILIDDVGQQALICVYERDLKNVQHWYARATGLRTQTSGDAPGCWGSLPT